MVVLKKLDKISDEMNSRDRLYMNRFTSLEKAQRLSFIPKNKPFPRKANDEGKQSSSQVPNTLTPTNVVEQESSFKSEQRDEEESEDEENDEQANIVDSHAFNIMLGGTYDHPSISEVTLEEEKDKTILNVDDSGIFKGVQYSRKNKDTPTSPRNLTRKNLLLSTLLPKNLLLKSLQRRILLRRTKPKMIIPRVKLKSNLKARRSSMILM